MKALKKLVLILLAVVVMGYVFVRSVRDTRAEPYEISRAHLRNWTLATAEGTAPNSPLLVLQLSRELASGLFRQLFTRHAESLNGPTVPFMPLLLQEEYSRSFDGQTTLSALLDAARAAGLEKASFTPRCMAHRREAGPGMTRQLYFLVFDAPEFARFREQIAASAHAGSGYRAGALSPVMLVAASDTDFHRWLPLRVDSDAECIAPISFR
jgi:hypothetical protein